MDPILLRSERCDLSSPVIENDVSVYNLYNHASTMEEYLPMLFGMDMKSMLERREMHRQGLQNGTSCFMDVLWRGSGMLIGTAGFRTIESDKAEWGIVVHSDWRRIGLCKELFDVSLRYLLERYPQVTKLRASTLRDNLIMRRFLMQQGMCLVLERDDGWIDYELPLQEFSAAASSALLFSDQNEKKQLDEETAP